MQKNYEKKKKVNEDVIITKLYNGSVELKFNEKTHRYFIDGKPVKGVTSYTNIINKPALIYWAVNKCADYLIENIEDLANSNDEEYILSMIDDAKKKHTEFKTDAATTGKNVHKWCENYIKASLKKELPELPTDEQELNGVTAFLKWVSEYKVEFLSSERFVFSKKYNYCGIMDAEAIIDGKKCVVDFKTSKGVYNEMCYQVSAYQSAIEEETGEKYTGNKWIVQFGKDSGEFHAYSYKDQDKDFKAFLACMELVNRDKELKR